MMMMLLSPLYHRRIIAFVPQLCKVWLVLVFVVVLSAAAEHSADAVDDEPSSKTCATACADTSTCHNQHVLQSMSFDVGRGNETAWVYVSPDVSSFYQEEPGSRMVKAPSFRGQCAKFINLSPEPVKVYWDPGSRREKLYIADIGPFEAAATAAYPTHVFVMTPKNDANTILARFVVESTSMLYPYDPIAQGAESAGDAESATALFQDESQMQQYTLQRENLDFDVAYRERTGRDWLSLFRRRKPPQHFMWPADYFGQEHVVTTSELYFDSLPPESDLGGLSTTGEYRRLQEYRSSSTTFESTNTRNGDIDTANHHQQAVEEQEEQLNLTLKVLSCEPRVFEIRNFLSPTEVDHIMELATGMTLRRSTTRAGSGAQETTSEGTRTSRNTWVSRFKSPIVDAIYRRASHVLQIDEALLRRRKADEYPDLGTKSSIAEDLQLVHYEGGQQYTPHHDWSVPRTQSRGQPARFATILFYLNDDMVGGETAFPRWKNAETSDQLKVKPETGKAILFYSILPDGNMDERSEHAALPVTKGEKWLTNLWVWDPSR